MGFILDAAEAKALLGQGLKVPTEDVTVFEYDKKIGPKGEQVKTPVKNLYWEEVANIKKISHELISKDEEWGDIDVVNIGVQISSEAMYQNTNPGRWVWNQKFGRSSFFEVPFQYTTEQMEEMVGDSSHPHQFALYKMIESRKVMKLMADLLIATGHSDLLVGKKTFVGFTDPIIDLLNSDQLIDETLKVRIVSAPDQMGVMQENIEGFRINQ